MVMALSGDITEEQAVRFVTERFGRWPSLSPPGPVPIPTKAPGAALFYLVKDTPQSIVVAGHFAPAKRSPQYPAFETLDFILGSGGFNARIFQEIRTNRGLSYSTGSFYRPAPDFGVFGVYALTKTDAALKALDLLVKILEESREKMPETRTVERAKRAILNSFVFKYQSSEQIAEQQMMLEFHSLPTDFLSNYIVKVERLTGTDLWETAKEHIHPDKMIVVVLGNEKGFAEMKRRFPQMERVDTEND
jgi:predicted Zn-dependent peptidase